VSLLFFLEHQLAREFLVEFCLGWLPALVRSSSASSWLLLLLMLLLLLLRWRVIRIAHRKQAINSLILVASSSFEHGL